MSADCHCQREHPRAGLVEQNSIHSSSSLLRNRYLPVKSFTCTSLLRPRQQKRLGLKSTEKNQHKQESSPVGFYSVFHRNITNHNHILGIYYMFQCFHISEQNKTPCCMLWYRTIKQASLLLKYQYCNFFHEIYFLQRYIPENTFSKSSYTFNIRQSWLNFSKSHLQDCCMMNLNNFRIIGNNVS